MPRRRLQWTPVYANYLSSLMRSGDAGLKTANNRTDKRLWLPSRRPRTRKLLPPSNSPHGDPSMEARQRQSTDARFSRTARPSATGDDLPVLMRVPDWNLSAAAAPPDPHGGEPNGSHEQASPHEKSKRPASAGREALELARAAVPWGGLLRLAPAAVLLAILLIAVLLGALLMRGRRDASSAVASSTEEPLVDDASASGAAVPQPKDTQTGGNPSAKPSAAGPSREKKEPFSTGPSTQPAGEAETAATKAHGSTTAGSASDTSARSAGTGIEQAAAREAVEDDSAEGDTGQARQSPQAVEVQRLPPVSDSQWPPEHRLPPPAQTRSPSKGPHIVENPYAGAAVSKGSPDRSRRLAEFEGVILKPDYRAQHDRDGSSIH